LYKLPNDVWLLIELKVLMKPTSLGITRFGRFVADRIEEGSPDEYESNQKTAASVCHDESPTLLNWFHRQVQPMTAQVRLRYSAFVVWLSHSLSVISRAGWTLVALALLLCQCKNGILIGQRHFH
jgi:hypothetical protein